MRSFPCFLGLFFALLAVAAVTGISAALLAGSWGGGLLTLAVAVTTVLAVAAGLNRVVSSEISAAVADLNRLEKVLASGVCPASGAARGTPVFPRLRWRIRTVTESAAERVTTLRAANHALEQNRTLLESILGTMVEGVLVLDSQERILYFNRTARQLLDCQARDVEGRRVWEVVRDSELHQALESAYSTGEGFRREFRFKRSNSVIELTATRLPLVPRPGLVVVLHNVTELRRLEHLRREFVSNVSHELKTPLTSIQAYADTLLEGGLEDHENCRLFVTRIVEQADRLQVLIQDMLRLARIESHAEAFELQPVLVSGVLEECVDARAAVARARGIELTLLPGDRSVAVLADARGVRTIVENLINNALSYTEEGGHVQVRWSVRTAQTLIEVQDDGIGIPAEHRERIFERFYRVDRARSRGMGGGGTGLGLAIVKHLASVFGGEIEVESEVGRGSLFRIRFPLASEQLAGPLNNHESI